ncbi:MAG: hypothetical protein WBQ89_22770 [Candidatus Acidiferrum sp.]
MPGTGPRLPPVGIGGRAGVAVRVDGDVAPAAGLALAGCVPGWGGRTLCGIPCGGLAARGWPGVGAGRGVTVAGLEAGAGVLGAGAAGGFATAGVAGAGVAGFAIGTEAAAAGGGALGAAGLREGATGAGTCATGA